MADGFGLAPIKSEGAAIPRSAEDERHAAEYARWQRSLAGRWAAFVEPFVRAWRAFRNKNTGW